MQIYKIRGSYYYLHNLQPAATTAVHRHHTSTHISLRMRANSESTHHPRNKKQETTCPISTYSTSSLALTHPSPQLIQHSVLCIGLLYDGCGSERYFQKTLYGDSQVVATTCARKEMTERPRKNKISMHRTPTVRNQEEKAVQVSRLWYLAS